MDAGCGFGDLWRRACAEKRPSMKRKGADMVMMLTAEQVAYLNLRAEGLFSEDICKALA